MTNNNKTTITTKSTTTKRPRTTTTTTTIFLGCDLIEFNLVCLVCCQASQLPISPSLYVLPDPDHDHSSTSLAPPGAVVLWHPFHHSLVQEDHKVMA